MVIGLVIYLTIVILRVSDNSYTVTLSEKPRNDIEEIGFFNVTRE